MASDTTSCGCSTEAAGDVDAVVARRPATLRMLGLGMALGIGIPFITGVLSAFVDDETTPDSSSHAGMSHAGMSHAVSNDSSWLGASEWYYGAMLVVLVLGATHALIRGHRNSCGSTPLGMGLMWGAMVAMALGMAVGVH